MRVSLHDLQFRSDQRIVKCGGDLADSAAERLLRFPGGILRGKLITVCLCPRTDGLADRKRLAGKDYRTVQKSYGYGNVGLSSGFAAGVICCKSAELILNGEENIFRDFGLVFLGEDFNMQCVGELVCELLGNQLDRFVQIGDDAVRTLLRDLESAVVLQFDRSILRGIVVRCNSRS